MAADEADGDRFIEIVSTGALYRGGQAQWERKYWSCSRGKHRYPYPVGYHAVRRYSGISYTMEIQQGPRGPVFQVTSTLGDSATGPTPDIAWKNFHKKMGSKVRNWQRTRSFPQKIDGVELFGFKNASVQRLLRQLIVHSSGFGTKMPCPNNSGAASPLTHTVAVDVSDDYEEQLVSLDKTVGTAKRSINPIHEESVAKRIHSQDILSSVNNCNDELDKSRESSDKGGPGSNTQLRDVSGSRCMPPLLEEIPRDSKCTRVDDTLGEYVPSSSQEDGLFSGSYSSSEKADLESAENEVAKSMMTSLPPQTIPLLKKTQVDDTLREYVPSSSQEDGLFSSSYSSSEKADLESAENEVAQSMMTSLLPQTIPLLKRTRVDDTLGEYVLSSSQEDGLFSSSYLSSEKADLESAKKEVSKSMMTSLLPQTIPLLKRTRVDDTLGEYVLSSSQEDGLFSSSYLSSEKADLESAENEVAKSMMTSLLPQTIPLLKKTCIKKKVKQKGNARYRALIRTASAQNPSADDCQGVSLPASIREGNMNSSQTHIHGRLLHETIKDSGTNKDCMNDEQVIKSDMEAFVADSFEDDAHIWCDNTSKAMGAQHHESDDACSREPNENSIKDSGTNNDCMNDEKVIESDMEAFVADSFEDDAQIWGDSTSKAMGAQHHESDDGCSREPNENSIKESGTNNDCMNDEQVIKSDMEAFVADSFEDDAQVWGDNTSKTMGAHHHESDDACSREPNENSKLLLSKRETNAELSECQVQAHDSADDTPDMIYDHDKGQYILSDAYLAFLEEEFGLNDSSHPAHFNHVDNDAEPNQPKDPKEGIANGSLLSVDGSDHMNMCNKHNVFHNQVDHTLCNINHVNGLPSKHPKTSIRGSAHHLELTASYLHPMPVLSIMLNTKSINSLHIYVLCGFLASCQRFLYVYNITLKDYPDEPPYFVGYTSLLLPSLEQASTGNFTFGRSGMQFTPDGQFLILLSSIRLPCCRMQNIDCSCSLCKFDQHDDNSLKIVSVNCGYSSLLTKLMPYGTVSSFLICEPNYVVAAEDSRKLHIWKMVAGWRDISKRALLSTFAAPGNIVFQILPLGICSVHEDIFHASVDDIERRLQEITVTGVSRKDDKESTLMLSGKDIAVWIMVSAASVAEYQHDLRAKEHNARWRLALLANKKVIMGNIFDPRATSIDVSGNYGFAGTYGGCLYMWELSSGRKLAGTECFNGQRVSCVAVDAKSRVVAVADDDCNVLLYTENMV
ncbi:uncharacterized protein LOC100827244 isoform X2 [Brachypodium distachyon]|uniref:FYR C-terminal domain-containing protein n=2 Tax=Brachypodium distachyon TaxID=15368 RepID=A0A0Q3E0X3_BRADI|nr:uncharacterized protein LOC100827244 isoform X2 [Brachypodium distachyon]KQJ81390.1 hypothetical protein BRADI_5g00430v3 [Brachypodium distachyon]|eukprot:XP_010239586.1 uncharacterized protein LOC100827244 isoform X2 [Brachypodium distachyon]